MIKNQQNKYNNPSNNLRPRLEEAMKLSQTVAPLHFPETIKNAVRETIDQLDQGQLRVAEPQGDGWQINTWIKEAILLYFRMNLVEDITLKPFQWCDKVPLKIFNLDKGVRVVPPAVARHGAFVAKGCVLMPSYINIGAYVDEGTMVDTWATVGSCAQIGKGVHLSGGVGIGGVLEPVQASPVIVEDHCFLGSRAVVVEGVHIKRGAVLGAGVILTASTSIVDMRGSQPEISKGMVPENCVVIPGSLPKTFPAGVAHVPCALLIGERKDSTDRKTSLNQALREFDVLV